MTTTIIEMPEVKAEQASKALSNADSFSVISAKDYEQATMFAKGLVLIIKEVRDTFADSKAKAFAAHKAVCAAEKKHLDPLLRAEKIIKTKIVSYIEAREREAEEERRKIEEAEKKRIEDEAIARAIELEKQGKETTADEVLNEAKDEEIYVPPQQVAEPVQGISYQERWDFEIEDQEVIPNKFMTPDMKKIRGTLNALKGHFKCPGIRTFKKKIPVVKGM